MRNRHSAAMGKGLLLIALFATCLLAGCGSNGDSTSDAQGGGKPTAGGVMSVAMAAEVQTLNPFEALDGPSINVLTQINESLFRTEQDGSVQPWLVQSFKTSSDHLTWTFDLQSGVRFSDGTPMTAEDVVFSLEAAAKSPLDIELLEPITKIRAASPSQVVVETSKPMADLTGLLTLYSTAIVPKNYGGATAKQFAQHPVGTGPYELAEWKQGQSLTLKANPGYWKKGFPLLEKIVVVAAPDDSNRISQLRAGGLNVIESPAWVQIQSLEQDSGVNVSEYALARVESLVFNVNSAVFSDRRVREAANLAIDRNAIVKTALVGHGQVAGSFFSAALPFTDKDIEAPEPDLAKARQLLEEASADGVKPTFNLNYVTGESYAGTAAQTIQQNLEEVGFTVSLQPLDLSALLGPMTEGKFDAAILGYYASSGVATQAAALYSGTGALFAGADTTKIGELGEEAAAELDPAKRQALYDEFQEEINRELNLIPLSYVPFVWAMQSDVAGFQVNRTGLPRFAEVGFTG